MAGDIRQFFGGIKSIQRGILTNASPTATLSPAVDTTKTELRHLGTNGSVSSNNVQLVLTNSTTVTATSSGTWQVSWELTEYYA